MNKKPVNLKGEILSAKTKREAKMLASRLVAELETFEDARESSIVVGILFHEFIPGDIYSLDSRIKDSKYSKKFLARLAGHLVLHWERQTQNKIYRDAFSNTYKAVRQQLKAKGIDKHAEVCAREFRHYINYAGFEDR